MTFAHFKAHNGRTQRLWVNTGFMFCDHCFSILIPVKRHHVSSHYQPEYVWGFSPAFPSILNMSMNTSTYPNLIHPLKPSSILNSRSSVPNTPTVFLKATPSVISLTMVISAQQIFAEVNCSASLMNRTRLNSVQRITMKRTSFPKCERLDFILRRTDRRNIWNFDHCILINWNSLVRNITSGFKWWSMENNFLPLNYFSKLFFPARAIFKSWQKHYIN